MFAPENIGGASPKGGRPTTCIDWLLRQLAAAKDDLLIEGTLACVYAHLCEATAGVVELTSEAESDD